MASPEITNPRTFDLRSMQLLASECRQRLAAVDQIAASAAAAVRASRTTQDLTNLSNNLNTLNLQLRALTETVNALAAPAASTSRPTYILIEVEGNDGEDGFFRV